MFGRLTTMRLKTAEEALRRGRLDEAWETAIASDVAKLRSAQDLIARVCDALLERAQQHLMGCRFRDALGDLDKAARCGVQTDQIAEWRQRTLRAMEKHDEQQRRQRQALDAASRELAAGALTMAGEHLERVPDAAAAKQPLQDDLAVRAERARRMVADAREAMEARQFAAAVDRLEAARRDHATSTEALELADALSHRLNTQVREALEEGQLDRAAQLLGLSLRVDEQRPETAELTRAMNWIDQAGRAVRGGKFDDAAMLLSKFCRAVGAAAWAEQTRRHVDEVRERIAETARGPLGLRETGPGVGGSETAKPDVTMSYHRSPAVRAAATTPPTGVSPSPRGEAVELPRRLLLRIDGVGSFLLLRGGRVAIGRTGTQADLPIQADLSERHAEILRSGEDYFLIASSGVELAGQPVQQALLSPGDRIQLNRRVRLTFERPSRKSPTAVLKLGDGVRSLTDVRRAILWTGPILIGPTPECHIPVRGGPTLVLLERGGTIQVRAMPTAGVPAAGVATTSIGLDQPVEIGDLRLYVQGLSGSSGGPLS